MSKKEIIRKLAKYSKGFRYHRKQLPQFGGNLGLIINAVLPILWAYLKNKL